MKHDCASSLVDGCRAKISFKRAEVEFAEDGAGQGGCEREGVAFVADGAEVVA
jgi:hypothetical protein